MTDFEKYDSAEADRVMELLRLQLAEQEKVEEKAMENSTTMISRISVI